MPCMLVEKLLQKYNVMSLLEELSDTVLELLRKCSNLGIRFITSVMVRTGGRVQLL